MIKKSIFLIFLTLGMAFAQDSKGIPEVLFDRPQGSEALHMVATVDPSPNAARLSVEINNPYDSPIFLETVVIDFPDAPELSLQSALFAAELGRFSRVELETERIRLSVADKFRVIEAGGNIHLSIGSFIGPRRILKDLDLVLTVETAELELLPVWFRVAYAEKGQDEDGTEYFRVNPKRFTSNAPNMHGSGPTCEPDAWVVYNIYAISRCESDVPCTPYTCQPDGTTSTLTFSGLVSYNISHIANNCACLGPEQ